MFELTTDLKNYHKISLDLVSRLISYGRTHTLYSIEQVRIFNKSKTGQKIFENLDGNETLLVIDALINPHNAEVINSLKYYTYIEGGTVFNVHLKTKEGYKLFGCTLLESSAKADGLFRLILKPVLKIDEGGLIDVDDNEEERDT